MFKFAHSLDRSPFHEHADLSSVVGVLCPQFISCKLCVTPLFDRTRMISYHLTFFIPLRYLLSTSLVLHLSPPSPLCPVQCSLCHGQSILEQLSLSWSICYHPSLAIVRLGVLLVAVRSSKI